MLIVLVFASAFASPYGPALDDTALTLHSPTVSRVEVPDLVEYSPLHGEGVIELRDAPPVMPAPHAQPAEVTASTVEAQRAITVEARTRE